MIYLPYSPVILDTVYDAKKFNERHSKFKNQSQV